jgi:acetyl esterase/lipase
MKFFSKKTPLLLDPSHSPTKEIFIWPEDQQGLKPKMDKEKTKKGLGLHIVHNIHQPTIKGFIPSKEKTTGTAIIIAPGGSHRELWVEHEGDNPAKWFCENGIAAFVLKYRLSKELGSPYSLMDHSLADIRQAIRYIRSNAKEWGIKPARIGVMGFSAGGELAALAAMHPEDGDKNASDPISRQSSFPNFQALIYPAGIAPFLATKHSPPLFLLCGDKDHEIASEAATTYLRYQKEGIPTELHIYAGVGHGFGIQKKNTGAIAHWPQLVIDWLESIGLI